MRRFIGLLALGAVLFGLTSAQAQQRTYTQSIPFQTNNQSMWRMGSTGIATSIDLTRHVSTNGLVEEQARRRIDVLGTFSAGVKADFDSRAGLVLNPYAREGNVNVSYPVTLNLTYPDPATLAPGQTFTLTSSWTTGASGQTISMNTTTPRVGVGVDGVLRADRAYLYLSARAFGAWVFRRTLFDTSFDYSGQLFDTANLPQGSLDLIDGILSVNYERPVLNSSASVAAGQTLLRSSASDNIVQFDGNITNALAYLASVAAGLPQPVKFSDSINARYRGTGFRGSYDFLTLNAYMPLSMVQQFQFSARPRVTLNLSTGQTVTFQAGQSIQLTMPANGSPLVITPNVSLDNQFSNHTVFTIGPAGLIFTPLDVDCNVSLAGYGLPDLHYSFGQFNLVRFGSRTNVNLYDQSFSLNGFTPTTLPEIRLGGTPPPPLTANNDTYQIPAADQFGYYTIHVNAPGVLGNDSGPTGFSAVPQTTDAGYYFNLRSDGSFDFQAAVNPTGQYAIPYTITDGQGHTSSAMLYITVGGGG